MSPVWCLVFFSPFSGLLLCINRFKNPPGVNRTCTADCAFLMLWVISPTYCSSYLLWLIPGVWLCYFTAVLHFCLPPVFALCFSPRIFFSPNDPFLSARPSLAAFASLHLAGSFLFFITLFPSSWSSVTARGQIYLSCFLAAILPTNTQSSPPGKLLDY